MAPMVQPIPDGLVLGSGSHEPGQGYCVMEAVAYVSGEAHTDEPVCACPVIGAFLRAWNDAIPDAARRTALLAPLVLRLVDSRSTAAVEQRRSDLAFDWFVRVQTPAWLDLRPGLAPHALTLRALPPLVSAGAIDAATAPLVAAQKAAADDEAAAWDAAWAAAWAAARAAARAAAWAAAWDAAWAAAWDEVSGKVAAALRPSVTALQTSALELVDRMLAVTPDTTEEQFAALCAWSPIVRPEVA